MGASLAKSRAMMPEKAANLMRYLAVCYGPAAGAASNGHRAGSQRMAQAG